MDKHSDSINTARNRREFLKDSSKMAALVGGVACFGAFGGQMFGADSKTQDSKKDSKTQSSNAKDSKITESNHAITLNNGLSMPLVGLGTYDLRDSACVQAMQDALSVGYRLFDTAQMYANESEVGKGLKRGLKAQNIARERIFVTTKLSNNMTYAECKKEIDVRLKKLDLGYIDLLLLHREFENSKDMWRAMQEAHKAGKVRSLGLSNFSQSAFLDFIKTCEIKPVVNQLETHVFFQRREYQGVLEAHGVRLQAWSPFSKGKNDFFNNEVLLKIGKKHNKSAAQVGLNYLVSRGVSVIPKTSKIERMRENLNIFDFTLDKSDIDSIAKLDTGKSSFGWFNA
ncbi:aldo/keto reductase [Helicobacter jaachi]|uniref:Aldo/keto reductase n=1 Tax=Helicobacter jaachi TaxID=1677920 RepID=A0A4U8T6I0_9HELI|nr:aldo/keto reductase [Helicobacter jaachi]TLD95196.1 aldo/keto reductase [Helicobacter jaachi]